MMPINEPELLKREGFFSAFEQENHNYLMSIIRAKIPETDAADVYQDALLSIWAVFNKAIETHAPINNPRAMAAKITKRAVANFWRTRKRQPDSRQLEVDPPDPPAEMEWPKETTIRLSPAEKRVLFLIGLAMGNEAIGERLHVSLNTVRTHARKIHKKTGIAGRIPLAVFASKYVTRDGGDGQ